MRVLHPNGKENPTFLPGDKVRDKRDRANTTWRIVARVAHEDTELMTLRKVEDRAHEITVRADALVPHLEMVAMRVESEDPSTPQGR